MTEAGPISLTIVTLMPVNCQNFTLILQTLHFPYGGCVAGEDAK